ncbi:hypothetical protein LSH36_13g26037 [Paralvinella palmiformis]|uniref:Uncharacterized protein n=1 Tax=Paralvinella palmiformis TaxID=53620 RepID=A0AAD9KD25_9ANNE|nr:hypothetical protein LSH36_13g26037 [Paralvinella palmiformis]
MVVLLVVIYRPPTSKPNGHRSSAFLDEEWSSSLTRYTTTHKDILIVHGLNFHLDVKNDRDAQRFISVLKSCGLQQYAHEPTHVHGHTLDVVITRDTSNLVSDIDVSDPGLCDHMGRLTRDNFAVTFIVNIPNPAPCKRQYPSETYVPLMSRVLNVTSRPLPCHTNLASPWMDCRLPTMMD